MRVNAFMLAKSGCFPAMQAPVIKSALNELDDDKMTIIEAYEFKNPLLMLLISFLVGELGIDRFLLGQTGLGILKLLTCGGCGIWWLVDLFLVQDKTRQYNYEQLRQVIGL